MLEFALAVVLGGFPLTGIAANEDTSNSLIEFSTWGMPGEPRYAVILKTSGSLEVRRESLPMTPHGPTVVNMAVPLTPSQARELVNLATLADDFDVDCQDVADGTSARMNVRLEGKLISRSCLMARVWPAGPKTRRFLQQLNLLLPNELRVQ